MRFSSALLVALLGTSTAAAAGGGLSVTVVAEATTIAAPGPAVFRIDLENTSKQDITVCPDLAPQQGAMSYEIVLPNGERLEWRDGTIAEGLVRKQALPPGGVIHHDLLLAGTWVYGKGAIFLDPERSGLKLRATYHLDSDRTVSADSPPITIRERTVAEQAAFAFWHDRGEFANAIGSSIASCEQSGCVDALPSRQAEFLGRFPDDPASVPIAFDLAKHANLAELNAQLGGKVASGLDGRKWFSWVVKKAPRSLFADDATLKLVEYAIDEGKTTDAAAILARFDQDYAKTSSCLPQAQRLKLGLSRGLKSTKAINDSVGYPTLRQLSDYMRQK